MNLERIKSTINVEKMQQSHVTIIGGGYWLGTALVRCGLGAVTFDNFDRVNASNPARQDFFITDLGRYKVEAAACDLRRINPDVDVTCLTRDFCSISPGEFDAYFGHTDLFVFATDFFPAQARGNAEMLRLGKPALWIGLYRGGRAGEIVYYVPGLTQACYRCICASRYQAFTSGVAPHTSSAGGTIFDLHLVDSIAGQIATGILTRGSDNRIGRLIDKLNQRNLLQVKSDPDYRMGERDIFGQYLGHHPANFSFTTIALPMERDAQCPDCGHLHTPNPPATTEASCAASSNEP